MLIGLPGWVHGSLSRSVFRGAYKGSLMSLSRKQLEELAKKHKPPQSWYDEDSSLCDMSQEELAQVERDFPDAEKWWREDNGKTEK